MTPPAELFPASEDTAKAIHDHLNTECRKMESHLDRQVRELSKPAACSGAMAKTRNI